MVRRLINKLKLKKAKLNNEINDNEFNEEQSNFKITISNQNNIFKVEISDYISIGDYVEKMKSSDEFYILKLICNYVLWNGNKQKVNKGTYYVIAIANCVYNILFTDETIEIDQRTKLEIDEQTQKVNITQERAITFDINTNEYYYFSAKHDEIGNTFYTKYYDKNNSYGGLDLSTGETYEEIISVIYNLKHIDGIENILDIEQLEKNILETLEESLPQRKKIK